MHVLCTTKALFLNVSACMPPASLVCFIAPELLDIHYYMHCIIPLFWFLYNHMLPAEGLHFNALVYMSPSPLTHTHTYTMQECLYRAVTMPGTVCWNGQAVSPHPVTTPSNVNLCVMADCLHVCSLYKYIAIAYFSYVLMHFLFTVYRLTEQ